MQYMLQTLETEADFARRTADDSAPYWAAWQAYTVALREAGVLVSGNGLEAPFTATTIRVRDNAVDIHDGPFAEGREQFAGYYIIEAETLDEAIKWAARAPCASTGAVEIRPVMGGGAD